MKIHDFVHNVFGRMSKDRFQFSYDGRDIKEGAMDVYELAPALLSLGDLVRDANRFLNQDRASVAVQVQSDFQGGSFEISIVIDQNLIEAAKAILFSGAVIEASGLTKLIFGDTVTGKVITGLIKLYKALNGKKPDAAKLTFDHAGKVTYIENLYVDADTANLYMNDIIRNDVDKVMRPLAKPGIDKIEVRKDKQVIEQLSKENLPARVLESGEQASEKQDTLSNYREALLKVVTANFEKGKWKFSDGAAKFNAEIEDPVFRDQLDRHEVGFYKDDSLRVQLKTVQTENNGKIKAKYSITEVIEHKHSPRQSELLGE